MVNPIFAVRVDRDGVERTVARYRSEVAAQLYARRLFDRLLAAGAVFTISIVGG